jgi:hypothetical protein
MEWGGWCFCGWLMGGGGGCACVGVADNANAGVGEQGAMHKSRPNERTNKKAQCTESNYGKRTRASLSGSSSPACP